VASSFEKSGGFAPGFFLVYTNNMAKQTLIVHKNPRGRPIGSKFGETIPVRLDPQTVAALDEYAKLKGTTRSKAIRTLLALAFIREALAYDDKHETIPTEVASKPKISKK
jgi:hypothetical protein